MGGRFSYGCRLGNWGDGRFVPQGGMRHGVGRVTWRAKPWVDRFSRLTVLVRWLSFGSLGGTNSNGNARDT